LARRFHTLDVFTDRPLAGNPLAVVLGADTLSDETMQAIAGEFNLSETVFVCDPRDSINTARLRIFTPTRELPFAGHPTVGTACLLAHLRAGGLLASQDLRVVLEEGVGDVVCEVRRRRGQVLAATFELPRLPERLASAAPPRAEIAAAFGLAAEEIGFGAHEPSLFSAGAPFLFVPVRSLAALRRARPGVIASPDESGPGPAAFLYTSEVEREGSAFHARMFGGAWGVVEDPATGSAAAAFAGVLMACDKPGDGEATLVIEQGFEMGRPSLILLGMSVEGGALRAATIGGSAVIVSAGTLDL
jgi:trans-2,3-dihydro-3-hydroxyanthranilate isomerase